MPYLSSEYCTRQVECSDMNWRAHLMSIVFMQYLATGASFAQTAIEPLPEKFEDSADWVICLEAKPMREYLKFPKSPIVPLMNVEVTYKIRNQDTNAWGKTKFYETFWYHQGKPQGVRRHEKLTLPVDSSGVIKIRQNGETAAELKALTNAALRLLPDIYLHQSTLLFVLYPNSSCNQADSELSTFRFYKVKKTTGDIETLTLRVMSESTEFDKHYYYAAVRKGQVLE